jgi:oligoendopeptidase F
MLTNQEKIEIVSSRLKSLESSKYDVDLSIEEENSIESPSQQVLDSHQARLADVNARIAVLQTKLEELS